MKKFDTVFNVVIVILAIIAIITIVSVESASNAYARSEDSSENIRYYCDNTEYYANTAVITGFDYARDIVICEDSAGRVWEFYEIDDWEIGDCVSLLLNNVGTQFVTDDIIVSARYSGFHISR